jgi:outer membrane protein OmpA-like peptidoglycan-associated protein
MFAMRGRWRSRFLAVMLLAVLAACGDDSPDEIVQTDPGLLQSDVGVSGGQPPSEARVGEILSGLQTSQRPEGTVISLPENILFEFTRDDLKPESPARLDQIAEVLRFYASAPVEIRGYTDSRGSEEYNLDLAKRRAESVQSYLTAGPAIDPGRLTAVGLGEADPVAPNENPDGSDNPAGREQNRRVEIVIEGVTR